MTLRLTYNEIFKYSNRLNPISSRALFLAGKLAELEPRKVVLDLGSGKGFPSLLWASAFGVEVEGFDSNKRYVEYANSYAKLLNLSDQVRYICQDVKELKFRHKYDVVASLGLGIVEVYGSVNVALKIFRTMLRAGGFLILGEPVWLVRPVPNEVQEALGESEKGLCTKLDMENVLESFGFESRGAFVSSREDWEYYIRPAKVAMWEMIKSHCELAGECQKVIDGFEAEYRAVGKYWDMVLWVAKC